MKRTIQNILSERKAIFKRLNIGADCDWFSQTQLTNLEDLVEVFYHPQGVEFCQSHNYPSLEILRTFKNLRVERFGVYIDAGRISLHNPERVILIGTTTADITCDKGGSNIIVMHNAGADITASDWAVVRVHYNDGCEVSIKDFDRAKVTPTKTILK